MSNKIQQDTSDNTSIMSDETHQTFTCEICIEPAMLSQKFGHGANCDHNICFMCDVATTKCACPLARGSFAMRVGLHGTPGLGAARHPKVVKLLCADVGQDFAINVVHKFVDMCNRVLV
ncbi:hypothetical protein SASPL_110161 [Salvia splendens]|uniref:RING-type domain-containing protein n=1 Tax=Salvia splendens TaxID=180675 RepID=A0A8X8Y5N6_SALSN|nr:hypothetical protein SASPL_110161 [Salvia splendens]